MMKRQLDVASLFELAEEQQTRQNLSEECGSSTVQVYRQVKEGYGYEASRDISGQH